MRGIRVVLLLLVLLASAMSAQAYVIHGDIEDIYLVRPDSRFIDDAYYPPEYLELEDLVFYTCLEEENLTVHSSVICPDENSFDDVIVHQWSDKNCFIASYDLSGHECQNVLIRSTYEVGDETVTLEREVKENRLTSVMDHIENSQYSDGGWADATDTAYGLWAMSYFPDIYNKEISLGLDWLKANRDNEYKCWPSGTCSPFMTANILGILTESGFNDSLRIMHDGLIWLERYQNYYNLDNEWTLNVTPYFFDTQCLVSYQLENVTVNISLNSSYLKDLEPNFPEGLYVLCTDPVIVNLYTQDGEEVLYYEGDNLTYDMPGAGWSAGVRWSDASVPTTTWALMTNISKVRRDAALEWLTNSLHLEGSRGKYVGSAKNTSDSALYLYAVNRSPLDAEYYEDINYSYDDVLQWLRFEQNNEGSWGDGNVSTKMAPTGDAVMALLNIGFNRTNEIIEDAEEWVSENELEYGWNTTKKNAYAFFTLKNNARPFLKSVPSIIIMDSGVQTIELYNPTTYDLKDLSFEWSKNLEDLLEIETQDGISAYSYIRLDITQLKSDVQDTYGYLNILNGKENISKLPVMVVSFPAINVTAPSSLRIFGTKGQLKLGLVKTSDTFSCTLSWADSDVSSKKDFTFVNENEILLDLKFTKAERLEKDYAGEFLCTTRDRSFLIPFKVDIDRYPSYPISVEPDRIFINTSSQEPSFIVKNLLDETVDVELDFKKLEDFFDIEKSKLVLNPAEERNVTIYNVIPPGFNVSTSNEIKVTALGQTESIKFLADVTSSPAFVMNPIVFWSLFGIILLLIAGGGFYAYKNKDVLQKILHPKSKIADVKNRIKDLEHKGTRMAIHNLIKMLRFQGKKDSEINKRLKSEGFTDAEIDDAFKNQ